MKKRWKEMSRDTVAVRRQVPNSKKNLQYTGSKIFDSGVSSAKRQILFMATDITRNCVWSLK